MELMEIAERLSCTLEGDGKVIISGLATLEDALPGDLSFLTNPKYLPRVKFTKASAIIAGPDCPPIDMPILRNANSYLTFAKAIELFYSRPPRKPYIHPTAWISESAVLGDDVSIKAFAYIGDGVILGNRSSIGENTTILEGAEIGEDTLIHSGVVVRENVFIGKRCIIQDNAVIGSDGFGFAKQDDGTWYKIPQVGKVVIGDDVEIGACSTIDRAALGKTSILNGTKIDNLVHIGHGSQIGNHSLLCAQVGLAGSTKVGNKVILAGQVGAAGHLTIGDGVMAVAQSGIPSSVDAGKVISGSPAIDQRLWLKTSALFPRLPELHKAVRRLEKKVDSLERTFNVRLEGNTEF